MVLRLQDVVTVNSFEEMRMVCAKVFPKATGFEFKELKGGATNTIYKVQIIADETLAEPFVPPEEESNSQGREDTRNTVLIRVYGEATEELIDREKELHAIEEIGTLKQHPPVYCKFANGIILGYFPGKNLTFDVLGKHLNGVAKRLASFHTTKPQSINQQPLLFPTLRSWAEKASKGTIQKEETRLRFEKLNLPELTKDIEIWEPILSKMDVVFCHNDLTALNILFCDKTQTYNFIDYEYCGYNYRCFDIGNHFCEYTGMTVDRNRYITPEQQLEFLSIYVKNSNLMTENPNLSAEQLVEKLLVEATVGAAMSNLFWGIWGIFQVKHSKITDYDFMDYCEKRLQWYRDLKPQIAKLLKIELQ